MKEQFLNDAPDSDQRSSDMQNHEIGHDEDSPTPPSVVVIAAVLASVLLGLCCYILLRQ